MLEKFVSNLEWNTAHEKCAEVKAAHENRAVIRGARKALQSAASWLTANAVDFCDNTMESLSAATSAIAELVKASAWFSEEDPRKFINQSLVRSCQYKNVNWWVKLAMREGAGLSSWDERALNPYELPVDVWQLPWIYDLHKIINNLAEKRGWGTRYTREGDVVHNDDDDDDSIGPDVYIWSEGGGAHDPVWYRSCTWNTIAKFTYVGYGQWKTQIWHHEGPVCRYLEMNQKEAEGFDWFKAKALVA